MPDLTNSFNYLFLSLLFLTKAMQRAREEGLLNNLKKGKRSKVMPHLLSSWLFRFVCCGYCNLFISGSDICRLIIISSHTVAVTSLAVFTFPDFLSRKRCKNKQNLNPGFLCKQSVHAGNIDPSIFQNCIISIKNKKQ